MSKFWNITIDEDEMFTPLVSDLPDLYIPLFQFKVSASKILMTSDHFVSIHRHKTYMMKHQSWTSATANFTILKEKASWRVKASVIKNSGLPLSNQCNKFSDEWPSCSNMNSWLQPCSVKRIRFLFHIRHGTEEMDSYNPHHSVDGWYMVIWNAVVSLTLVNGVFRLRKISWKYIVDKKKHYSWVLGIVFCE